ncbi:aminotransferase-like domain-containing protein [Vibrio salinus]|uniref:aminotransferase-like domain-containing protein n=1 Tax=Vibrio salinus TaxID=2899784 RepID=UPI001E61FD60|nr:PLP-dependent aminotransferase family protein [Vibrio salinus]MCE0494841.1 PLP-dependent aminotransferase family protein [Vibrio salinus]
MSESKFEKIALIIEKRIISGEYPPNFKLPTHKSLAAEIDTTPATVAKAYKLLIDKKKIESFVGRGSFVCGQSSLEKVIHPTDNDSEINLSILQPDLLENVTELSSAYSRCAQAFTPDLIGYAEHSGHEKHRLAGVAWAKSYGLEYGSSENTLLVDGAQNALALAIIALTKPGDTIAVESLTYPGILAIASLYRRNVCPVAMDNEGMIPDVLEKVTRESNPALVIVVPSHQNPTGVTMSEERRKAIAKVILKSDCWLVEDDIYGFLNSDVIPAICNRIPDQGIHITSLSKAISPAMRCGFMKMPEALVSQLASHIRTNIWLSSPLNYAVASYLIENGCAYDMAERQRKLAVRRQAIARDLFSCISGSLAGFHIWLPLPEKWTGDHLTMEAKNRNVLISSGSYFSCDGHDPKNVRISLMSVSNEQQLEKGLSTLSDLMHSEARTFLPF